MYVVHYSRVLNTYIYQRTKGISTDYNNLRGIIRGLAVKSEEVVEAGRNFKTERVREALDKLIQLVIEATQEVSSYYSQSKMSELSISRT